MKLRHVASQRGLPTPTGTAPHRCWHPVHQRVLGWRSSRCSTQSQGGKNCFYNRVVLHVLSHIGEIVGNNGSSVSITSSMIPHIMVPIHLTSHLARILRAWSSTWLRRLCIHLDWLGGKQCCIITLLWSNIYIHIPLKLVVGRPLSFWVSANVHCYISFREGTLLGSNIVPSHFESMIFLFPFGGISYVAPCSLRGYSNITMSECVMAYHDMIDVVASVQFRGESVCVCVNLSDKNMDSWQGHFCKEVQSVQHSSIRNCFKKQTIGKTIWRTL